MRSSPFVTSAAVILLAGCGVGGAISSGMKSLNELAGRALRGEMEAYPHQVCAFDAPMSAVMQATREAMVAEGYEIRRERVGLIESVPLDASRGPTRDGRGTYRLTALDASTGELDEQRYVRFLYREGLSRSEDGWRFDLGMEDDVDADDLVEESDLRIRRDADLYEPLMDRVASTLGEAPCAER